MKTILNISDAAAIAVHAADRLARAEGLLSAHELAAGLPVSYDHLAKVLQQLARSGLVEAVRGPRGGFKLSARGARAALRDFVEAIEGPVRPNPCLMRRACGLKACLLGDFLRETDRRFGRLLATKISALTGRN